MKLSVCINFSLEELKLLRETAILLKIVSENTDNYTGASIREMAQEAAHNIEEILACDNEDIEI